MYNYIKVDKTKADEIMQDTFKYMPMFITLNGAMIRVIAKKGNDVYYVE